MSARRSPVERDARRLAANALRVQRKYRGDRSALDLLNAAADGLARDTANRLLARDLPDARRHARAHQLVDESRTRLSERQSRAREARYAREEAAHGIQARQRVRVVRAGDGTQAAVGTVHTVDRVSGNALYVTIDGVTHVLWATDVEPVPAETGPESAVTGVDLFECSEPGCDFVIGAAGPLDPDEPDYFGEGIEAHQRSHAESEPETVDPDDPTAMALPVIGDRVLLHDGLKADVLERAGAAWRVAVENGRYRHVWIQDIAGYLEDEGDDAIGGAS